MTDTKDIIGWSKQPPREDDHWFGKDYDRRHYDEMY